MNLRTTDWRLVLTRYDFFVQVCSIIYVRAKSKCILKKLGYKRVGTNGKKSKCLYMTTTLNLIKNS